MAGALIGALLGAAFGTTMAAGATLWGFTAGTMWMLGASIGSLFDQPNLDFGGSSPNYAFSAAYNTKSQLLPVPVCYGRVRMSGNIFMLRYYDDKKQKVDEFIGLSQGPINRVISVFANEHVLYGDGSGVYTYWTLVEGEWEEVSYAEYVAFEGQKEIRDEDGNVATVDLQECSCDVHLGEPDQPIDSREPTTFAYPNVAYIALTLKIQDGLTGDPTVTTELEGRKVWTPSGTRYTNNPIWCLVDLLTNTRYGVGIPISKIDLDVAEESAAYCDELVDGRPRYTLNYILDQQKAAPDVIRDICLCFNGYIRERDKIEICVDRPVTAPARYLDVSECAVKESFTWWQKGREETYNRIIIEWIDPENDYDRASEPFENEADILARGVYEKNISMLGVTDPYQVGRLGEQALGIAQDIRNYCSFTVSVKDWDLEVGDVVGITEASVTGWNRKWFHVLYIQDDADSEQASVTLSEYSSSSYVDTPIHVPETPDNPDPNPALDNYSNLLLTDEGKQQEDGTYVPRIRVRYTPPAAEMKEHVVNWWHSEEAVNEKKVSASVRDVLVSEGVRTGEVLTVRVWGTDLNGKKRTGVIAQITPGKDSVPPGAPTGLTAEGWFGDIILSWINPATNEDGTPCTDLAYVEVWESSTDDRSTAVNVAEINGTTCTRHLGSFAGRWYWIRAVDTSGNISQWNAEAGVFGYSDQESHQDFVDELFERSEYLQRIEDDLNTGIDSIAEAAIEEALSSYQDATFASLVDRKVEAMAEAALLESFSGYEDWKHSYALIRTEQTIREDEDEALASQITTIAAMLGDPENPGPDTIYAAITEERTARAARDGALATSIDNLVAVIGDPNNPGSGTVYAAIEEAKTASATADEALAEDIETLGAAIGDPDGSDPGTVFAAIKTEQTARAAADTASASSITTLQTKVDGHTTSIQQVMASVDGIEGEYSVKIDSNGYMTGWKMIGGAREGSIIFHVDNFMVGRPGTVREYPFVIGTVDGVTKVSMANTFIQDAAISAAKIKDLTVGTLKIAKDAVSVMAAQSQTSTVEWTTDTYKTAAYVTPSLTAGYPVLIQFTCNVHVGECTAMVRLLRNGSVVGGQSDVTIAQYGDSARFGAVYSYVDQAPSNGLVRYELQMKKYGGLYLALYTRSLWALHTKR